MLSSDEIREALDLYGDSLYRLCLIMLQNAADAEDAVEETFIKYMMNSPQFEDDGKKKAWLTAVAANKCRDMLRFRKRHATESEELLQNYAVDSESTEILDALMEIPEKYRIVMTLHYVDGYKISEIAEMLKKSESAIKMRLAKGRSLLEEKYRKDYLSYDGQQNKVVG